MATPSATVQDQNPSAESSTEKPYAVSALLHQTDEGSEPSLVMDCMSYYEYIQSQTIPQLYYPAAGYYQTYAVAQNSPAYYPAPVYPMSCSTQTFPSFDYATVFAAPFIGAEAYYRESGHYYPITGLIQPVILTAPPAAGNMMFDINPPAWIDVEEDTVATDYGMCYPSMLTPQVTCYPAGSLSEYDNGVSLRRTENPARVSDPKIPIWQVRRRNISHKGRRVPFFNQYQYSRSLLIMGVPAHLTDAELFQDLSRWGTIRALKRSRNLQGRVYVHFYDLRDSKAALADMQREHLFRQLKLNPEAQNTSRNNLRQDDHQDTVFDEDAAVPDVSNCVVRHQSSGGLLCGYVVWAVFISPWVVSDQIPDCQNQGTLVLFNIGYDVEKQDLYEEFRRFGAVREVREGPRKRCNYRFVEFYDIRDAAAARTSLIGSEICGKQNVMMDFSYPVPRINQRHLQRQISCYRSASHWRYHQNFTSDQNAYYHNYVQENAQQSPQHYFMVDYSFPDDPFHAVSPHGEFSQPLIQLIPTQYSEPVEHDFAVHYDHCPHSYDHYNLQYYSINESLTSNIALYSSIRIQEIDINSNDLQPECYNSSYVSGCSCSEAQNDHRAGQHRQNNKSSRHDHSICNDTLDLKFDEAEAFNPEASGTAKTTLMIRNIPNRFSQGTLLRILDEHCLEQNMNIMNIATTISDSHEQSGDHSEHESAYDFLYLPIDFRNECNLGYAFVNFTSAVATVKFFRAFHGKPWSCVDSCSTRKICEITCARIQGRAALVEHFKNSKFLWDKSEYLPVVFEPLPRNGKALPEPKLVPRITPSRKSLRFTFRRRSVNEINIMAQNDNRSGNGDGTLTEISDTLMPIKVECSKSDALDHNGDDDDDESLPYGQ